MGLECFWPHISPLFPCKKERVVQRGDVCCRPQTKVSSSRNCHVFCELFIILRLSLGVAKHTLSLSSNRSIMGRHFPHSIMSERSRTNHSLRFWWVHSIGNRFISWPLELVSIHATSFNKHLKTRTVNK